MIASRILRGGAPYTVGSGASRVQIKPGSMKAATIQKTVVHGRVADSTRPSEPGTRPAALYALTLTAAPRPCSLSVRISRR